MRGLVVALVLALAAAGAAAQEPTLSGSTVVTLDQDRLFAESRFGRAVVARNEADEQALAAENRKLEAAFEAEERSLTELRASLPPAEFRKLADEFDARVEETRRVQEGRFRALVRQREEDRRRFTETALPLLGRLMSEMGAVVLLDRSAIVLSLGRIDITDDAIARLDAELGDGQPVPGPAPAPDQVSAPAPAPAVPPGTSGAEPAATP